jgi:hypothetical protein
VFVHVALLQRVADSMQYIHDTAHAAAAATAVTTGEQQQHAEEEASATCAIFYSINR